jgi:hypothetical protein
LSTLFGGEGKQLKYTMNNVKQQEQKSVQQFEVDMKFRVFWDHHPDDGGCTHL